MLGKKQYLSDPCGTSSIPYWKALLIPIPSNMKILHHSAFEAGIFDDYMDDPYFRLMHDLQALQSPVLRESYSICTASVAEFAAHINTCYDGVCINEEQLKGYSLHPVYDAALWLAVRNNKTGEIVATGIAELDIDVGEGILEWIQVSKEHRRCGLGRFLVLELLWRMKNKAQFVTVSGQYKNPSCPELFYRKCGFTGQDVWHILQKRDI